MRLAAMGFQRLHEVRLPPLTDALMFAFVAITVAGAVALLGARFRGAGEGYQQTSVAAESRTDPLAGPRCLDRNVLNPNEESREPIMRLGLVAAALITLASSAFAHDAANDAKELKPGDVAYEDNPAFPKGAQTAVVYGDPAKPGMFILRAKFPPNYVVPPHTHPVFESVTVLSGTMGSGMGETVEKAKGKLLGPGSLLLLPADHPHYVWAADEEVIIQVTAVGPFDLKYINPADDPRNK